MKALEAGRGSLRAGEHDGAGVRRSAGAGSRHAESPCPHPSRGRRGPTLVGSPIKLSRHPGELPPRAAPRWEQHTDEVLAEVLNLDESEREALRAEGVI